MGPTVNGNRGQGVSRSPFFARTYGGFTRGQVEYFRAHAGAVDGKTIIDPMAGQAVEIAMLPLLGSTVYVADVNPAPLLMAALRHPSLLRARATLLRKVARVVRQLPDRSGRQEYVEGWFSQGVTRDFELYATATGIDRALRRIREEPEFWSGDIERLFWVALPLLCARDIACYRTSDNVTWIKPGGLARVHSIRDALQAAAARWFAYGDLTDQPSSSGALFLRRDDAVNSMADMPPAHLIVTSPPYANRLDYASLWSPELAVFSQLTRERWSFERRTQIGTTIVRGLELPASDLTALPERISETLAMIRCGAAKASDSYYYPFFANYALSLGSVLRAMAQQLRRGGKVIIFVRDTVRKDVLFETGQFVEDVFVQCGLKRVDRQRRVIRQHIGSLRKLSTRGMYGTAQQEWWLTYQKA